jgi:ribosomal protein S18 acetylase RimI-like enzyme
MKALPIHPVQTAADWNDLAALLRTYAAHDLDQPHLSTIWKDLTDLPARYSPPQGLALLMRASPATAAVACGAFAPTQRSGTCEIKRIYVSPAERGRGLASQLIAALLQHARQAGYTHAALSTWRSNLPGQALYARLGFKPVPPFKEHPNPDLLFLGLALPDH